jgi:hypothetical protein
MAVSADRRAGEKGLTVAMSALWIARRPEAPRDEKHPVDGHALRAGAKARAQQAAVAL